MACPPPPCLVLLTYCGPALSTLHQPGADPPPLQVLLTYAVDQPSAPITNLPLMDSFESDQVGHQGILGVWSDQVGHLCSVGQCGSVTRGVSVS